MSVPNYYELYKNLKKFKGSNDSYMACCPFHDDKTPSLSIKLSDGLSNCFGSCNRGYNAYQIAEQLGYHNPSEFIDDNGTNGTHYTPKVANVTPVVKQEFGNDMDRWKKNLKNNMDKFPSDIWDSDLIDEIGIGLDDNGKWVFGYYNKDNECIGYNQNKFNSKGLKAQWYPSNQIDKISDDKDVYLCEGEKDEIPLKSLKLQAFAVNCGCGTIPKDKDGNYDLQWLKNNKKTIYICYDAIDSVAGAKKMADEILKINPMLIVKIIQWDKSLPKGFDVYDAFKKDNEASEFFKAKENAITIKGKRKGFKMFNLSEFMKQEYKETEPIVESILYSGQTAILGGDTGTKKSMVALASALSIASGVSLFEHFKIKQQKVLLIQFENENFDMQSRYRAMLKYYIDKVGNRSWINNVQMMELESDNDDFTDNWIRIEETIKELNFSEGVLIVDNIYTSTDKEIQNNDELKQLVATINKVRRTYDLSILLMAHCNKDSAWSDKCLHHKQIQGGAILCSNIANVTMIGNSTTSNDLGLMKIVKAGRSAKNELLNIAFKLHWSDDSCTFSKGVIVPNEAIHFTPMKSSWEIDLIKWVSDIDEMKINPTFDRAMFRRNLKVEYKDWNETQITRYLNKMIEWGLVKKIEHNKYRLLKNHIQDFTGDK